MDTHGFTTPPPPQLMTQQKTVKYVSIITTSKSVWSINRPYRDQEVKTALMGVGLCVIDR